MLGAALVLLLLGLAVAQTESGRGLLRDAGLSAPAEPFTELAFTRPADLPRQAGAPAPLPVSFRIANSEGADRLYPWRVTVGTGADRATVARGRASVADGTAETISTLVPAGCTGTRVRLRVVLDSPAREIGAWVPCAAEATP